MNARTTFRHASRLATLLIAVAAVLAPAATPAAEVGQPAPDLALQGPDGPVKLSDLRGKVVYLDFWASWCGPCRHSFPWMNEMQAKYGARGFQVLGVNLDARRADAEKFLAAQPARFALAFDAQGDTAKQFAVKGMPTSLLIGPDGKVIAVHQGFREEERQDLEARVVAALDARH